MINVFNFFNKVYEDLSDKNYNRDEDLIKYFKSEYGKEWKIELDKHLLKTEFDFFQGQRPECLLERQQTLQSFL